MKLLLDQCLPRSTVQHLRSAGIDCEHVAALGYAGATDDRILALAVTQDAVVVTLDADFHRLLAASGDDRPSVIRIRIEGLSGRMLSALLEVVLAASERDLETGAVLSVSETRIRVHSLPIGK